MSRKQQVSARRRTTTTPAGANANGTSPDRTAYDYGEFHDGMATIKVEGAVRLGPCGSMRMMRAEITRSVERPDVASVNLSSGVGYRQDEFNAWINDIPANEVGALVEALTGAVRLAITNGVLPKPATASGDITYPYTPDTTTD